MKGILFVLGFIFLSLTAIAANPFIDLSKDKSSYVVGERAVLKVALKRQAENPAYEFFVKATFNAAPVVLTKVSEGAFYTITGALEAGEQRFRVETFLQDKKMAAALAAALDFYDSEIARITEELNQATDPDLIARLEAELAENQALRADTGTTLNGIRTKVDGPESLIFQVQ